MQKLVEDMLKYSKTRNIDALPEGSHFENDEDVDDFTVMVINVLEWLRLGYKRELWKKDRKYVRHKPLPINLKYPWCRILKDLTENNSKFSQYFFVTDKGFDFRETVPEEERVAVMELVYHNLKYERIT